MSGVLEWLQSLPPIALYFALAIAAMAENLFPPLPADSVVAFGSFLAARGKGSAIGSFLATYTGNMLGVTIMYYVGHRYGPAMIRKLTRTDNDDARTRMQKLYGTYGYAAIFISRFIPGVRSVVAPFAGAMHIPAVPALICMGIASAIWYGAVTWLAFNIGENFSEFTRVFAKVGRYAAIIGGGVLLVAGIVYLVRRKRADA